MITEGQFKIIGGGTAFITYLINAHKSVRDNLYPEAQKAEIDKLLNWFQFKMRPETQLLIRMIVPPKVLGGQATALDKKQKQKDLIFADNGLLSALNGPLSRTGKYICGSTPTVVDILFYCEISTIIALTRSGENLGEHNRNVTEWFKRMKTIEGLPKLDSEMSELINKFDLAEK